MRWTLAAVIALASGEVLASGTAPDLARQMQLQNWKAQFEALPAHERERIGHAAAQVATLTPDARQALRAQFDSMDRQLRDGWRLGPTLGRWWPQINSLVGHVSESERGPLLVALRRLDGANLARLARLASLTPPSQRAAVRRSMLAQPPDQLAQWLEDQVGR